MLVVVTVLDINDNSPTFLKTSYAAAVVENSNIGNTILAVQAKDGDEVSAKYYISDIFLLFCLLFGVKERVE